MGLIIAPCYYHPRKRMVMRSVAYRLSVRRLCVFVLACVSVCLSVRAERRPIELHFKYRPIFRVRILRSLIKVKVIIVRSA